MSVSKKIFVLVLASAGLAACATPTATGPQGSSAAVTAERERQQEYVLDQVIARNERLQRVAYPVMIANVDYCGTDASAVRDFYFTNAPGLPREYQTTARRIWNLGDLPQVRSVLPGSAAERSGLQVGDTLISIDGREFPTGRNSNDRSRRLVTDSMTDGRASLTIERGGSRQTIALEGERGCGYDVVLDNGDEINAYADGRNIHITQGLMRFVESDEELALVVAHELAHNAMGHVDSKRTNAIMGGAAGLAVDILFAVGGVNTGGAFTDMGSDIGSMAYSVAFEQEADYVGLYFMTRAGYNTDGAENFWRRMAAENPRSVTAARTHPTTPERFLSLAATREEIAEKQENGMALTPNLDRDAARARREAADAAAEEIAEDAEDTSADDDFDEEYSYD